MPLCLRPLLPGHNGGHGVLNHSSHAPSASKRRYDGGLEAYERVGGAGKEENPSAWDDVASSNTASQLPKPSPWPNMILCSLMCGRGGVWRRLTSSRSVKSRFRSRSGPQRARTPIFRLLAPASRNFSKFLEISAEISSRNYVSGSLAGPSTTVCLPLRCTSRAASVTAPCSGR